jgi:hypothetical protein
LIAQDRQIDGLFTGYNVALERTVLKKAKYLANAASVDGPVAKPAAVPTPPAAEAPAPASGSGAAPKVAPQEAAHPLFAAPPVPQS